MSIIPQLKFSDHQRLRKIVMEVHMKNYPDVLMTNTEADRIIESIAPEVLAILIKAQVDARSMG